MSSRFRRAAWFSAESPNRSARRQMNLASQRDLEHLDGARGDGVHHLLMETRVCFRRIEAIVRKQPRIVQIDSGRVEIICSVVVYDRDLAPGWAWAQASGNVDGDVISQVFPGRSDRPRTPVETGWAVAVHPTEDRGFVGAESRSSGVARR